MTNQEIYDKVKAHLLAQGKTSRLEARMGCAYRGADGTKCAVGCLIPDEAYSPDIEGLSASSEEVERCLEVVGISIAQCGSILSHLQRIHDAVDPKLWRETLEAYARKEGLVP